MSTTASIVEVLVVGIQSGVAILLWAVGLLGYGVLHKPLFLLDMHGGSWRWITLFAIVMLAACYTLGVLIDRISMVTFDRLMRPLLGLLAPDGSSLRKRARSAVEEERTLVKVLNDEENLSSYLQDLRCRQRIARATAFNIVLIVPAFFFVGHLQALLPRSEKSLMFVYVLGGILLAATLFAWMVMQVTYEEKLRQAEAVHSGRK